MCDAMKQGKLTANIIYEKMIAILLLFMNCANVFKFFVFL